MEQQDSAPPCCVASLSCLVATCCNLPPPVFRKSAAVGPVALKGSEPDAVTRLQLLGHRLV